MLSPLIVSGLRAHLGASEPHRERFDAARFDALEGRQRRVRPRSTPERVVMWRCPVCDELHDDDDDAADCCAIDDSAETHPEEAACICPVCGTAHASPGRAADCCLWNDLAAGERADVARRVEEGATWLQAIEAVDGPLPDQLRHLINESPTE